MLQSWLDVNVWMTMIKGKKHVQLNVPINLIPDAFCNQYRHCETTAEQLVGFTNK